MSVYNENGNIINNMIECPPIIKQMIIKATLTYETENTCKESLEFYPRYRFKKKSNILNIPNLTLIRTLKKYPLTAKSDKKEVFRVDQCAEYFGSTMTFVDAVGKETGHSYDFIKELFNNLADESKNIQAADFLVLCDRNAELRKYVIGQFKSSTDESYEFKDKFKEHFSKARTIIIGIKNGVNDEGWLDVLAQSVDSSCKRCIMILTADDLRKAGLNITEHGTIEQNIREIVGYLDEYPLRTIWEEICCHLVVIFRESQVLYLNKDSYGNNYGSYHCCPYFDRPTQIRPVQFGKMPGKFTIQMTSIIKYLILNEKNDEVKKVIEKALRLGILAYNQYFKKGYCSDKKDNPFQAIAEAVSYENENKLYEASDKDKEFYISSLEINISQIKEDITNIKSNSREHNRWSRTDALFDYYYYAKEPHAEEHVLRKIVTDGLEAVIHKDDPKEKEEDLSYYKIICPPLELGDQKDITIIDENHMNGFIDLTQLIRTYLSSHNKSEKPLSIAVFGPPGEGKSFSIKKIIKHISPERKSEDITFNLAQFDSIDQLTEAFHQIQDAVLKHLDEPPLVIFDEFDANYGNQELGWLKFFLAPMQDDSFHGKSGDYKVGGAIFVFSGGTSKKFQDFDDRLKNDPDKKAAVKLNDFIGRLRGFMDVKGVNSDTGDISRIVKLRRAILLRSLLNRHAKHIFSSDGKSAAIHHDVIDAFLEAKEYRFGIRSMEAIIKMSKWIDNEFVPASLPSLKQLEMHVDPQAFKDVLFRHKT